MEYQIEINGLAVTAQYSKENIKGLFLPLLEDLTRLQKEKGRRILVMMAAPPAAGKSTLSEFLSHLSRTTPGLIPLTVIGMDGFHRRQEYLLTHTVVRDGEEIPMVRIKGAPVTFDLEKFTAAVRKAASGAECSWPLYSRPLKNPIEDAIKVRGDIVLLEGNYLLLDEEGWRSLRSYADFTVCLRAEPAFLRERLICRRVDLGESYEDAAAFVDYSDMPNVRLCLEHSLPADKELQILPDGRYLQLS